MPRYTNKSTGQTISSKTPLTPEEQEEAFAWADAQTKTSGFDYAEALVSGKWDKYEEKPQRVSSKWAQYEEKPQTDYADLLLGGSGKKAAPPPPRDETSFSPSKTIGNIPESAFNLGKAIVEAVTSPLETARNLGKTAVGGVQLLGDAVIPSSLRSKSAPGEDYRGYIQALGSHFVQRYGGKNEFLKTVQNDPVGFLTDLAAFTTGGGTLAAKAGLTAGKTVAKVGAALDPLNVAKQVVTAPVRLFPEAVPSKLYQSAVKFSTTLSKDQRAKLTATALDEQIAPNVKGLAKARDVIDGLNDNIAQLIDDAVQTGQKIPLDRLFTDFDALKKTFSLSGTPMQAQRAVEKVYREIELANLRVGRMELTAAEAQKLKQRIYKDLESWYGKTSTAPAAVEAQKAVARQAKTALEEIIPEIKQLNAREGALIELYDALERSANRITNRDFMGIGLPIKTGAGGAIGGWTGGAAGGGFGAVAGLALGLLDTPAVKARLALVMHRLKEQGVNVKVSPALKRLLAAETAMAADVVVERAR